MSTAKEKALERLSRDIEWKEYEIDEARGRIKVLDAEIGLLRLEARRIAGDDVSYEWGVSPFERAKAEGEAMIRRASCRRHFGREHGDRVADWKDKEAELERGETVDKDQAAGLRRKVARSLAGRSAR